MATIILPADNEQSEQITPSTSKERSVNEVFVPKDTLNQPCDIVLVVQDSKQFKAHRKVLSEASPFFEKLLKSDMKESKEGIVRLEMFSESVMAATLGFVYTGHVQISTEDNARDLIVMADYLFLQKLNAFAGEVFAQKLNISNCISNYYFSEKYQCKELLSKSKKFILANFTAVYAAKPEDVLSMSNKEVEMWISSDEIDVSAEEDVFKIILAWIDHDKTNRMKYFAELFRHVRLVYVSRDFLSSDVVTNDLVKDNDDCLDLVKDTMSFIDSRSLDNLPVSPRKSFETSAIVMPNNDAEFLCYFPDEDSWCRFGEIPFDIFRYTRSKKSFFCGGKLYNNERKYLLHMVSYDPYANSWMRLPSLENRCLWEIFARNEDEMCALFCDACVPLQMRGSADFVDVCETEHSLFISKYKPESHSWEDIASRDHFHPMGRNSYCVVASDHFVYFIGGVQLVKNKHAYSSEVDRYDFRKGQWDKVADIQVARSNADGVAANGKVFIAGGRVENFHRLDFSCEMYDEATNEWQFIARIKKPEAFNTILVANGKLYAVSSEVEPVAGCENDCELHQITVECYDPEKNEWKVKSEITFSGSDFLYPKPCSMRIFKRLFNFHPLETSTLDSLSAATVAQASSSQKWEKLKCKFCNQQS